MPDMLPVWPWASSEHESATKAISFHVPSSSKAVRLQRKFELRSWSLPCPMAAAEEHQTLWALPLAIYHQRRNGLPHRRHQACDRSTLAKQKARIQSSHLFNLPLLVHQKVLRSAQIFPWHHSKLSQQADDLHERFLVGDHQIHSKADLFEFRWPSILNQQEHLPNCLHTSLQDCRTRAWLSKHPSSSNQIEVEDNQTCPTTGVPLTDQRLGIRVQLVHLCPAELHRRCWKSEDQAPVPERSQSNEAYTGIWGNRSRSWRRHTKLVTFRPRSECKRNTSYPSRCRPWITGRLRHGAGPVKRTRFERRVDQVERVEFSHG